MNPFSGENDPSNVCIDCFGAEFSTGTNNFECQPTVDICPPDTFLPPNSTSPTDCQKCPPGTDFDGTTCTECRVGFFNDGVSTTRCTQCPIGSITSVDSGATECTPCPPGTFQPPAVGIIGFLPPNECQPCPQGTEALGSGNPVCRPVGGRCPPRFFENNAGGCRSCSRTERYSVEEDKCVACEEGLFSSGGTDQVCKSCEKLPPTDQEITSCRSNAITCFQGQERKGDECVRCPRNTFQTEQGPDVKCKPCPPNTFNSPIGSSEECKSCPACTERKADELFCVLADVKQCKPPLTGCEPGLVFTPDGNGEGQCGCPDLVTREVATRCNSCIPTVFGAGGETNRIDLSTGECSRCSVFEFTDGFEPCMPCPDDSIHLGDGTCGCRGNQAQDRGIINGKCTVCPPGSVGRIFGGSEDNRCVPCPPGTAPDPQVPPVPDCMGRFCPTAAPKCKPCEDGFFNPEEGGAQCKKCPDGFATFGEGATACFPAQGPNQPGISNEAETPEESPMEIIDRVPEETDPEESSVELQTPEESRTEENDPFNV